MDTSITAAVGLAGLAGTIFYYAVIKPLTGAIADLRELIHDMREDLEALARAQYRSLHSLILEILADALRARRKEQEESENVANVVPRSPTP